MDRWTDRQIDRQTDRQTERQTDREKMCASRWSFTKNQGEDSFRQQIGLNLRENLLVLHLALSCTVLKFGHFEM
jgi:hypothetical protein